MRSPCTRPPRGGHAQRPARAPRTAARGEARAPHRVRAAARGAARRGPHQRRVRAAHRRGVLREARRARPARGVDPRGARRADPPGRPLAPALGDARGEGAHREPRHRARSPPRGRARPRSAPAAARSCCSVRRAPARRPSPAAIASRLGWPFVEIFPAPACRRRGRARPGAARDVRPDRRRSSGARLHRRGGGDRSAATFARPRRGRAAWRRQRDAEDHPDVPRARPSPARLRHQLVRSLDPAFLRPGRFDYVVPIGPPDAEARTASGRSHVDRSGREDVCVDCARACARRRSRLPTSTTPPEPRPERVRARGRARGAAWLARRDRRRLPRRDRARCARPLTADDVAAFHEDIARARARLRPGTPSRGRPTPRPAVG